MIFTTLTASTILSEAFLLLQNQKYKLPESSSAISTLNDVDDEYKRIPDPYEGANFDWFSIIIRPLFLQS